MEGSQGGQLFNDLIIQQIYVDLLLGAVHWPYIEIEDR